MIRSRSRSNIWNMNKEGIFRSSITCTVSQETQYSSGTSSLFPVISMAIAKATMKLEDYSRHKRWKRKKRAIMRRY